MEAYELDKIKVLATSFRGAIEIAKDAGEFDNDFAFPRFPKGCCGDTSDLLAEYLAQHDIYTYYVCGQKGTQSHAWLVLVNTVTVTTDNSDADRKYKSLISVYNEDNDVMIPIPSERERKSIVGFANSISEKIRCNAKVNDNLYAQVKAIFSENFLDLDFLPDGWKTGNLLDIADYLNGLAMQKYRPKDGETGLPVLKIKELRQGICDASSELCSPSIKSEYIIHDGDIIFSWSGSLLVDIWCGGTCGLNQHLFKVTSNNYDKWFYYLWTAHHLDRFIAVAADKATTMGHIKREELEKVEVIIPSKYDYKRIGASIKPLFDLIISNRIEDRKLTALRNTLLPKIMSGEIDVRDIQL